MALLRFEEGVQEVFAVQVLPGRRYPELINDDAKLLENSFVLPDEALCRRARLTAHGSAQGLEEGIMDALPRPRRCGRTGRL